jgi:hypothetical protein
LSMREGVVIDSPSGERAMPKPYSIDLRGRVVRFRAVPRGVRLPNVTD